MGFRTENEPLRVLNDLPWNNTFFLQTGEKNTTSENGFQLCDRWKRLCQPATAPAGQEGELVGYTMSALSSEKEKKLSCQCFEKSSKHMKDWKESFKNIKYKKESLKK